MSAPHGIPIPKSMLSEVFHEDGRKTNFWGQPQGGEPIISLGYAGAERELLRTALYRAARVSVARTQVTKAGILRAATYLPPGPRAQVGG